MAGSTSWPHTAADGCCSTWRAECKLAPTFSPFGWTFAARMDATKIVENQNPCRARQVRDPVDPTERFHIRWGCSPPPTRTKAPWWESPRQTARSASRSVRAAGALRLAHAAHSASEPRHQRPAGCPFV